jgi:hypothetical protein
MPPLAARFRVDRAAPDGGAVVLRPVEDGDEGLFRGEPSGSIQLGRMSDAGAALLALGAEVRLYVVPAEDGPQRFAPEDAVVMTLEESALGIFFPTRRAKARAVEILRDARQVLTLDERLSALRRDLRALPGADPIHVEEAVRLLERAWLAAKRAAGLISIEDPAPAPTQEPEPPAVPAAKR